MEWLAYFFVGLAVLSVGAWLSMRSYGTHQVSTALYNAPTQGNFHIICTKDSRVLDSETDRLTSAGWVCDGPLIMGGYRNSWFIQRMIKKVTP